MTAQIWEEFNERLLGFIKPRVQRQEVAEDILQEVFVKIHQKMGTIRDGEKITSWVYQITRNSIVDYYRKQKNATNKLDLEHILLEETETQNADFSQCIVPFIKQLSEKDQEILNKVSFGGLSQKEFAEQHNLSYSAAKSRLQRAREKLKKAFVDCCAIKNDKYGNILSYSDRKCEGC